ncbi:MAG: hypothetical protein L0Z53_01925, partial [Acidobacteriales bacterium]|nr:hypothetical protein [Terriglobales bacterium]
MAAGVGLSCGSAPALAQIPCGYEVTAVIQGPECGIFGFPPIAATGLSPNGRWVVGFYYSC